jgi:hypothetical protein
MKNPLLAECGAPCRRHELSRIISQRSCKSLSSRAVLLSFQGDIAAVDFLEIFIQPDLRADAHETDWRLLSLRF